MEKEQVFAVIIMCYHNRYSFCWLNNSFIHFEKTQETSDKQLIDISLMFLVFVIPEANSR